MKNFKMANCPPQETFTILFLSFSFLRAREREFVFLSLQCFFSSYKENNNQQETKTSPLPKHGVLGNTNCQPEPVCPHYPMMLFI